MAFLIFLGSGAVLLGLAFVIWVISIKRRAQGIANWPRGEGQIVQADVAFLDHETPSGIERTYTPVVAYTYDVAGQSYRSSRLSFLPDSSGTFTDAGRAQELIAPYPVGSRIEVTYNPANPKQSVLKAPRPIAHNAVLLYGLVVALAGGGIIALGILLLP